MTRNTWTCRIALFLATLLMVSAFGTVALADEKPELSVLLVQNALVSDYDENDFTKKIEEMANVDLVFSYLPEADAATKLNLMISSGEKLPDVICYGLNLAATYDYASAGAIVPIGDLLAENAPNLSAIIEKYPELLIEEKLTAADGNIYGMPYIFAATADTIWQNCWINEVWLEKLGLEKPTTIDELYDVLVAFRDGDPNGNGVKDEIPMTGCREWSNDPLNYLMNSFVYWNATDYLNVKDGIVYPTYMTEEWKEGVLYIRKLFQDGLLDPQVMSQNYDQMMAMVEGTDTVGCFMNMSPRRGLEFDSLPPVAGPDHYGYAAYGLPSVSGYWFVTADCEDPALAIKVADTMIQDDAAFNYELRYGSEGEYWNFVDSSDPNYIPKYSETFIAVTDPDKNAWNQQQTEHWRRQHPCFYYKWDDLLGTKNYVEGDDLEKFTRSQKQGAAVRDISANNVPPADSYIPFITYNEDETIIYNEIRPELYTFVDEMFAAYITGTRDIEAEWDSYIETLKSMGVEEFVSVVQSAYDRMYK